MCIISSCRYYFLELNDKNDYDFRTKSDLWFFGFGIKLPFIQEIQEPQSRDFRFDNKSEDVTKEILINLNFFLFDHKQQPMKMN